MPETVAPLRRALSPWAALALAAVLGMIAARGFATEVGLFAAMAALVALCALLLAHSGQRHAPWLFVAFGLGLYAVSFRWLMPSMVQHGGIPVPTAEGLYLLICAEVALFLWLPAWAALRALGRRPALFPWALAAGWITAEWLRSNLVPFAWNLWGYVWIDTPLLAPLAGLGSVYLVGAWSVGLAGTLVIWPRIATSARLASCGVLAALPLAGLLLTTTSDATESLQVRIVQSNVPQADKWSPQRQPRLFDELIALTRAAPGPAALTVWPEAALPFRLQDRPDAIARLGALARELDTTLLLGAETVDPTNSEATRNSLVVIGPDGLASGRHDKVHLVPFGEYLPHRDWWPVSLRELLMVGRATMTPGPGYAPFDAAGLPVGGLICYESIFPRHSRELRRAGAQLLVNVSNDGWFDPGVRPQHLRMSRVRAIEVGLPLVRVSNTGISAAFDAQGRPLAMLPADSAGARLVTVPLASAWRLNTHWGFGFVVLSWALLARLAWPRRWRIAVRRGAPSA